MPETVRVGIMCAAKTFPRWQADAIRTLIAVPGVDIRLMIVRTPEPRRRLSTYLRDWRHLLWNLFEKGYIARRSIASSPVEMRELAQVPEIVCTPERVGRFGEALVAGDIAHIRGESLDVILRFGFGILKGEILEAARFGVWSYHHGDEREFRGRPPAFWEMVERRPTVGAILQVLTERLDAGAVLCRGDFRVYKHSYNRTRDEAFLGSSDFLSIAVRRILHVGATEGTPSVTTAPVRHAPGNSVVLRFLLRQAWSFLANNLSAVTRADKWTIGVMDAPVAALVSGKVSRVDWVAEQGASRYLADPFLDPTGKTGVVLVEDYDYQAQRGVISAVDLDGDRVARVVLDAGVHASYPYLFQFGGEVYCTPETHQAEHVRIYRSTRWPDEWELVATILEGLRVLDPTIVEHAGRWWLFCTIDGAHSNSKLHIYCATSPFGPWSPHTSNPVKTSFVGSRPAGAPFVLDGILYRPAQDSSVSYGGALTINRIDVLTTGDFAETQVQHLRPMRSERYREGIHTLSTVAGRVVVDGRRDAFIPAALRRELIARLDRLR